MACPCVQWRGSPELGAVGAWLWSAPRGACILPFMAPNHRLSVRGFTLPVLLVATGLGLSACERGWRQTPYPGASARQAPALATPVSDAATTGAVLPARTVTVRPGDTVYAVSRRTGVPVRAIIVANGLTPPFLLHPGRTLHLPAQRAHTVAPGETLFSLSRRYDQPVGAIASANGLSPPFVIKVGETLVIPTDSDRAPPVMAVAQGAPRAPTDPAQPAPAFQPADDPGPPRVLSAPSATDVPPRATPSASPSPTGAPSPSPSQSRAPDVAMPPPPPMPSVSVARDAVPGSTAPPRAGSTFLWPVDGDIIGTFGPGRDGLHNDGINIAVPDGTPIRAAENGLVVYAGNEILGFGNLVLLRHADGWMTAYAHASDLHVRRGQTVRQGEVIAAAGRTGSVDRPQLHFEVRREARPVDPRAHLARRGT